MANKTEFLKRVGTLLLALLFLVTSVAFTAIIIWQSKSGDDDTAELDQAALQQTLEESADQSTEEGEQVSMGQLDNFTPFSDEVNELQKIDLVEGTGDEVKAGAKVTVHYTGAYAVNGEIFDSSVSRGETITFGLDEVIQGWSEGVPGMKVGGKRRLIIPGSLAYGEATEGYTPGDGGRPLGTLVFDIELFAIENQ